MPYAPAGSAGALITAALRRLQDRYSLSIYVGDAGRAPVIPKPKGFPQWPPPLT
jgi:hypothetical protein